MTDTTSSPRIVVGVDGSEPSKQALKWAAQIARTLGAQLDVVTAWHYPFAFGWGSVPLEWSPGQDMDKLLSQTLDDVFGTDRPADLRSTVREGSAVQLIVQAGEGALMIVVGSRGHGGFAGLLLGSVSAAVAEHATCPVLVVHGVHVPDLVASAG